MWVNFAGFTVDPDENGVWLICDSDSDLGSKRPLAVSQWRHF